MPWRFVKQPNGLLGRFSTIVDTFTDVNMTEEEALTMCLEEYNFREEDAKGKVERASFGPTGTGPLHRWEESLRTIEMVHGKKERNEIEELGSLPVPPHEGLEAPLPAKDMVHD